jgi:CheY-like chemotaxis protein
VAEDNKVNQHVARAFLEKLGCQVDIVENGRYACSALEREAYDLVLMDCHMPVMDGFEAAHKIRQMQTGKPRTPIIALTAAVLSEERQQCFAAGMDDFLGKPNLTARLGTHPEQLDSRACAVCLMGKLSAFWSFPLGSLMHFTLNPF